MCSRLACIIEAMLNIVADSMQDAIVHLLNFIKALVS